MQNPYHWKKKKISICVSSSEFLFRRIRS
uniref:Uncharacterized protein n=1 Tax=Anguilla anguilla TaxID=7936 RepID=A0A0E9S2K7_ANGAN